MTVARRSISVVTSRTRTIFGRTSSAFNLRARHVRGKLPPTHLTTWSVVCNYGCSFGIVNVLMSNALGVTQSTSNRAGMRAVARRGVDSDGL
jgi:hypothetical protein